MPKTAPLMKVQNTRALGAEVILEGDNYDEAYLAALRIAKETARVFVPAFENEAVIAGQGTLALELLEQVPGADFVVGSIGGGGMMAGVSVVYEALSPSTRIIGCQALGSPSMARSIREGHAVQLPSVHTFADGIAVKEARESMRKILAPRLDRVLEADDEQIAAAVLMLLEKAKIMTEGAAAISLAVLDGIRAEIRGKKVVLLISGGNIDVNLLSRIIDRGLIRSGRRLRLNVVLPDRPGALAKLTSILALEGANILQTIHDRNEPDTLIDQTEVELTLETRGAEHSQQVIKALEAFVLRIDLRH
jgi:threonine dehydratase